MAKEVCNNPSGRRGNGDDLPKKGGLTKNQVAHDNGKLMCPHCQHRFSRKRDYDRHMETREKLGSNGTIPCNQGSNPPSCDLRFCHIKSANNHGCRTADKKIRGKGAAEKSSQANSTTQSTAAVPTPPALQQQPHTFGNPQLLLQMSSASSCDPNTQHSTNNALGTTSGRNMPSLSQVSNYPSTSNGIVPDTSTGTVAHIVRSRAHGTSDQQSSSHAATRGGTTIPQTGHSFILGYDPNSIDDFMRFLEEEGTQADAQANLNAPNRDSEGGVDPK